jgi:hypothetical protein
VLIYHRWLQALVVKVVKNNNLITKSSPLFDYLTSLEWKKSLAIKAAFREWWITETTVPSITDIAII